jgi:hypothetical protein
MVVYGFKTDPVGGEALNEPVSLSVVDLPSAVSLADRLLDIRLRQMSFVKPKQGVIGPDKTLDGHRRESTCRAEPSRASEQTAALPKSPRIALNRPLFDWVAQASQRVGNPVFIRDYGP